MVGSKLDLALPSDINAKVAAAQAVFLPGLLLIVVWYMDTNTTRQGVVEFAPPLPPIPTPVSNRNETCMCFIRRCKARGSGELPCSCSLLSQKSDVTYS